MQVKKMGIKKAFFYNIDYDVTGILAHLPISIVQKLYLERHVRWKEYSIEYMTRKFFRISQGRYTFIAYDLWPFFQKSLDHAGELIGIQKKKLPGELIRNLSPYVYKKNRWKIDNYAIRDAQITQKLGDILCKGMKQIGMSTRRMYSPGYLAKSWLQKKNIRFEHIDEEKMEYMDRSYFGGRIEVFKRGSFKKLWLYDIKSSYPARIQHLPDITNAVYYWDSCIKTKDFCFIDAEITEQSDIPVLPWRWNVENLIIFPRCKRQRRVITGAEYFYLQEKKLAEIKILRVLNVEHNGKKPFASIVHELFEKRKEGDSAAIIYKLILNSISGIFHEKHMNYIQTDAIGAYKQYRKKIFSEISYNIGYRLGQKCQYARRWWEKKCDCKWCRDAKKLHIQEKEYRPKQKNLFLNQQKFYYGKEYNGHFFHAGLASYITAMARIALHHEMMRHKKNLVAVFTDCLILDKPSPYFCRTGKKAGLGEFEFQQCGEGIVLGSGIYQIGDMTKFRGFVLHQSLEKLLYANYNKTEIIIPQTVRNSMGMMIRRDISADSQINEIFDDEKILNINFDRKRMWERDFKNAGDVLKSQIQSSPKNLEDLL